MSSETSIVKLQAENIDLREQLSKVEARVEIMARIVTQAAARDDETRRAVMAGPAGQGGVSADDELFQRLKKKVEAEKQPSPAKQQAPAAGSAGVDLDAIKAEIARFTARIEELEAELAEARGKLDRSRAAALELDARAAELEKERDSLAAAVVDVRAERDAANERAAAFEGAEIEEEVQRRVEEGVFSATMELEDQITELKEENENLRETIANHHQVAADRDAAVESAAAAVKERSIALKVKDGAIEDAAKLRRELAERDKRIDALEEELAKAQQNTAVLSDLMELEDRVTAAEEAKTKLLARAETAEKVAENARQQAKEQSDKCARYKELWAQADEAKAEAELRVSALTQRVNGLSRERDSAVKQRDAAFGASEQRARAQERERDEAQRKHKATLERLKAKYKDSSEVTQQNYKAARDAYEQLIAKLQGMADAEAKEELICDLFFEYERKLWLLQADIASLRTVGDLRESDMQEDLSRQVEDCLSRAEMLRMQLQEAGVTPCC
eukprot:CAMPEP_0174853972 /NCGR_PEP_ID=MMETSP1114-20130205/29660_1 /TAXON_ID=312471 /ORGANISM="Neobodo designis, Strain CCAP 1951/1" /LENGTH=504 /DNA_ID=CAMNT_0016088641 /DNA_START=138 /DNA_END=1652 /DNA_ORIENTATION=+